MAEKCGKDKLWKWRACLSCRCDQGVEQVEESNSISRAPDAVSIKKPNWDDFWVGLPFIIVLKGTSQFVYQFVPVIDFFKIHLYCHFFPKNMTRSTTPNCLLNPPHRLIVFKYQGFVIYFQGHLAEVNGDLRIFVHVKLSVFVSLEMTCNKYIFQLLQSN